MTLSPDSAGGACGSNLEALLESGEPESDGRFFRRCLSEYGTGVALITAKYEGADVGITVNSFSSLSLSPPLIIWTISKSSSRFNAFHSSDHFAVNVLSLEQASLAMDFARHSGTETFRKYEFYDGVCVSRLLKNCLVSIECKLIARHEGGDHVILVGQAEYAWRFGGDPLLFVQGEYASKQSPQPDEVVLSGLGGLDAHEADLLGLLAKAYGLFSRKFDRYREELGLTESTAKVLAAISDHGPVTVRDVMRFSYLGERDTRDSICELDAMGYIEHAPDGRLRLSRLGLVERDKIRNAWIKFQSVHLGQLDGDETRSLSRLLGKLIVDDENSA